MRKSALALLVVLVASSPAHAFTQSGFGTQIAVAVPMGHEWLTRRAAIELLLGKDPIMKPDPNDPRLKWTNGKGLAKNLDLKNAQDEVGRIEKLPESEDRYHSTYRPIYDTIMGERWVDIGGFNIGTGSLPWNTNCWDAVAQEPVEIQYDHHMRRYDEAGGKGGVSAASYSQIHFKEFFVAAATAPKMKLLAWDGGALGPALEEVDRNYFLFGRALHLFQDSFSSEHVVRIEDDTDRMEVVHQVKSYLCAYGSEQHTHDKDAVLNFTSGDVIWKEDSRWSSPDWSSYKPSNMKTRALVAMEATKDLWAAFIRTMAIEDLDKRKAAAGKEADTLIQNWLSFNPSNVESWYSRQENRDDTYVWNPGESGRGQSQSQCMVHLGIESGKQSELVERLQKEQRLCLFNIKPVAGYADLFDPEIHMFFNWDWTSRSWNTRIPDDWKIPNHPADRGDRVTITSVSAGYPMSAELKADALIRVIKDTKPFHFIVVRDDDAKPDANVFIRARFAPRLFLSYTAIKGDVKLWKGTENSSYTLAPRNGAKTIMSTYYDGQYIWVDGGYVHLNKTGDPSQTNAQWMFQTEQP